MEAWYTVLSRTDCRCQIPAPLLHLLRDDHHVLRISTSARSPPERSTSAGPPILPHRQPRERTSLRSGGNHGFLVDLLAFSWKGTKITKERNLDRDTHAFPVLSFLLLFFVSFVSFVVEILI